MNEDTGEPEYSFGIITTTANSLLAGMGYKRMPVILDNQKLSRRRISVVKQLKIKLFIFSSYIFPIIFTCYAT
jgi:hypothetical protein